MRKGGFLSGVIAGGMVGAVTGMNLYRMMSPRQKRAVDKNIDKVIDQMTDVLDTLQNIKPFDEN